MHATELSNDEVQQLKGLDYTRVNFPENEQPRQDMIKAMVLAAKDGHTIFATQTNLCLNHVEDPDPDIHPPKSEWDHVSFFHDCKPEDVDTGSYVDITLFCRA